ncbi:replication termination factor 2 domain containing 1, partial [Plakobranchus ocellatus]
KDKTSELAFKWKHCAISQEALVKPIVACELGRLYKKESVLEFLLDRSKFDIASQFDHLRGLKDIKELNLTDVPEKRQNGAEKGDSLSDSITPDFICPVVGIEMNGKHRFCFLWSCGCVMSERAFKEIKCDTCHKCGKAVKEEDIVLLNGSEGEVDEMRQKMDQRRKLAKLAKKEKKAEKHKLKVPGEEGSSSSTQLSCKDTPSECQASKPKLAKTIDRESNGAAQKEMAKGPLGSSNGDKKSKGSKTSCIQDDPRASKTFKSLFTSSEAAKNQTKPNWITYNPLYY